MIYAMILSAVELFENFLMNREYRQRLSGVVRELRGERSQRQFAKELGVSYPAVRSWEEGESLPGLENLESIAAARGQSLEDFLLYLRGTEQISSPSFTKADQVAPLVAGLPTCEKARLIQLLAGNLLNHC